MSQKYRFNREVRLRHHFYAWINRLIVSNIIRHKYRFKGEKIRKKCKTPQLVLCNHQSELDPFLLYFAYKAPIYMVANEQVVTNPGYGFLLMHFMNPIPIKKGTIDINVIRRMKDVILEGGSVAVFPEANSTFDGQPCFHLHNPGKLAKMLGIEVVIYNLHGAYFSNPRWSSFRKLGPTKGVISKIISPRKSGLTRPNNLKQLFARALMSTHMRTRLNAIAVILSPRALSASSSSARNAIITTSWNRAMIGSSAKIAILKAIMTKAVISR